MKSCGVDKSTTHAASSKRVAEIRQRSARRALAEVGIRVSRRSRSQAALRGTPWSTPKAGPMDRTARAEELLRELGGRARLVVYIASAPGARERRGVCSKTRDGCRRPASASPSAGSKRKDGPNSSALPPACRAFRRVKWRSATHVRGVRFRRRACARNPTSSCSTNSRTRISATAAHAKRWQDALALAKRGIGVIGAFNIAASRNGRADRRSADRISGPRDHSALVPAERPTK